MTRILLLSPTAVPGGAERALTNLARHLPAHGFELSAVLLADGPLRGWLEEVGCPVTILPAGRTRHLRQTVSVVRRLTRLARQSDIVISNQSKGHVYGGLAARLSGRPAVWWQHGVPSRTAIETVAATIPAAAIVCGSRVAADAQRRLTPNGQVQLIPPGTDVAAIANRAGSGQEVRERLGWADHKVVGIVGRLQPWKGQEVFLRAAAQIARRHPEVRFAVVGGAVLGWEGDYPQQLQRLAEDLGIADLVRFAGHQDDVYPWFDAMDIVVHASLDEPFGLVLVEAMALGKPLVATASGGPLEIIEDGVSGLLVPPGDDGALAGAVERILDDPALAANLALAARRRADRFSAEHTAAKFAGLLTQIAPPADDAQERGLQCSGTVARIPTNISRRSGGHPRHEHPLDLNPDAMAGIGTHSLIEGLVGPSQGELVLDVGAGQGSFTYRLDQLGFRVIGFGITSNQFLASTPYVQCDLDRGIPVRSETAQGVVAIEVIEHLENAFHLLREFARVLTPDGWAILTTPNTTSLTSRVSFALRGYPVFFGPHEYETNGHIHPVALIDIQRMAERCGLTVAYVTYNVGKIPIPKLRHRIPLHQRHFRNRWLGENLIVKLYKTGAPKSEVMRG